MATGNPAFAAERVTPIASGALVMVIAVTMSAPGLGKSANLVIVIRLGSFSRHDLPRIVAIAARSDTAADHHWQRGAGMLCFQFLRQGDRPAIDLRDIIARVAELLAPIAARAPCWALQDEAQSVGLGDGDVALVVAQEHFAACRLPQQMKRGEVRQIHSLMEDQSCLDAAIGQKQVITKLWK